MRSGVGWVIASSHRRAYVNRPPDQRRHGVFVHSLPGVGRVPWHALRGFKQAEVRDAPSNLMVVDDHHYSGPTTARLPYTVVARVAHL
jgi:hypothetical protein